MVGYGCELALFGFSTLVDDVVTMETQIGDDDEQMKPMKLNK